MKDRNETIYCSGRCGRPAIREIDGMPWCKPCLITEGYSEAEGVAIHQAAPMMGGSVVRSEPETTTGKKPRERAFKPKPETAAAAVDRVMAEAPRPSNSLPSGSLNSVPHVFTPYEGKKPKVKDVQFVRISTRVRPGINSAAIEPQNGAAFKMRVMSAAEYSELTNRFLSTELELVVSEVRKMLAAADTSNDRLVIDAPKGTKARPFRDQVQRYFDRWHKDLRVHVTQNVKLNHIAVMADANTGRHAARAGKG